MRVTRVVVIGFATNIQVERSFVVTFDQVRSTGGDYGIYCQPDVTAPGNSGTAYVTTHVHLNCYYASNAVNIFYQTATTSVDVSFVNGASELATKPYGANGSSYSNYFGNISNLHFIDWYCESQPAALVIASGGGAITFDGLYLNGTGGIYLGSSALARFINVRTTSSTDVIAGGDGSQNVTMESCSWPATGNALNYASLVMLQTSINGVFYQSYLPTLRQGSGSPQSVVAAPVGTLFLRTDGGTGSTLYVKESGTGNTGWVAK